MNSALERAIEVAKSQQGLADAMTRVGPRKVTQQNISWWLNKSGGKVPAEYVIQMEQATGITRYDLRPDVFGEAEAA